MMKTARFNLRLSPGLRDRIERKAEKEGMKPSDLIRKVLTRAVSDGRCKRCRNRGLLYCPECLEQVQAAKERARADAAADLDQTDPDQRCARCKEVGLKCCPVCAKAVNSRNEETRAIAETSTLQDRSGKPADGGGLLPGQGTAGVHGQAHAGLPKVVQPTGGGLREATDILVQSACGRTTGFALER